MLHAPREVERAGHRVYGTDEQLDEDLSGRAERHGDTPVTDTVINHE